MGYNKVYDYLRDKIVRVNINNPKANWGARLLSRHMDIEMLDEYLIAAIDTIQLHFNTNNEANPSGQANLTMLSSSLGRNVLRDIGLEGEGKPWMVDQVRTGDLFLEPFIRFGYLSMTKPMAADESYIIKITPEWVQEFPSLKRDISTLMFTDSKPYEDGCRIKGSDNKSLQDRPWRRSATKLMSTGWKINKPVLEALRANKDMFMVDLPSTDSVDEHGKPDPYYKLQMQRRISKEADYEVIVAKATALEDKVFYQELEADYRGRMYYKEPFINFQGSDLARGTMMFAEGKAMTEQGKWWLAVHTAASYNQSYDIDEIPEWCEVDYKSYLQAEGLDSISVDKFTLEDRVRWTNENMEVIIYAGRERVLGPDAEKPVTFLACCIEWYNISESDGEYISHLPVGIDGSNNGWQHLGAISKDVRTGELVGLVATEIPRDFYVQTAKQLLEIDDPKLNAMPMKHVRKGISKRGSMTRAYSAGADKIGKNMWFDCRSEEFDTKYDITEDDCMAWARELIKAIDKVCPGPLKTMKYMQNLAAYHIGTYEKYRDGKPASPEYKVIQDELKELWTKRLREPEEMTDDDFDRIDMLTEECKEFYSVLINGNGGKTIKWTTPSGFPVVYEAYREDKFKCKGTINSKRINHVMRIKAEVPDVRKFMSGISPNYVHSMDASHMANVIDQWGGTFGAIHDSFSTHASDVEDLLFETKRLFVEQYSASNFLDKIRNDITDGNDAIEQPTLGSLEIQEVYDSDYFFA